MNEEETIREFISTIIDKVLLKKPRFMLIHDSEKRHVKVKLNEEHTFTYDLITAAEYNAKGFAIGMLSPDGA